MTLCPVYLLFTPAALVPNVNYLELCISAADRARGHLGIGDLKPVEGIVKGGRFDTAETAQHRLGTSVNGWRESSSPELVAGAQQFGRRWSRTTFGRRHVVHLSLCTRQASQ